MRILNPAALAWCYRIATWGADPRSRSLLFAVSLLTCMDPRRCKPLQALLRRYVQAATDSTGLLSLRGCAGNRTFSFPIRGDNSSDYQSLTECLGDMYPAANGIQYVLDGGANVGLFAPAGPCLPDLTEVAMVEPSPANLDVLRRNTRDVLPGHWDAARTWVKLDIEGAVNGYGNDGYVCRQVTAWRRGPAIAPVARERAEAR